MPKTLEVSRPAPALPANWRTGFHWPIVIGGGGTEEPFLKDGKWFLYCYDHKEKCHKFYDFAADIFIPDSEFYAC